MRTAFLTLFCVSIPALALAQEAASVEVRPAALTVRAGGVAKLEVTVRDAAGRALGGQQVTWFATPFDIAGTDSTGLVTTTRAGRTFVYAVAGGKVGIARLDIQERLPTSLTLVGADTIVVGGVGRMDAQAFTSVGDPVPASPIEWSSSEPRAVEVSSTGAVRALAAGRARITVRSLGLEASRSLTVVPNPVSSLRIIAPATIRVGEVVALYAEPRKADGLPARVGGMVWGVEGAGAEVEPDGRFVALTPGRYLVSVSLGSVAAVTTIEATARLETRVPELVAHARLPAGVQGAEIWLNGNAAYVATISNELYTYDIADPAAPALTDSLVVDARLINDVMTTADGRLGVLTREGASDRKNGLIFFDASNPLHPRIVGQYSTTLTGGVHSAFVDGHYAYATSDATGSLRIIDFQDPAKPVEVGRYELPRAGVSAYDVEFLSISPQRYLHDVYVKNGIAYLAYWRDGLVILDVGRGIKGGSPSHPVFVSQYNYNHAALYPPGYIAGTHAVFADGHYVFLGDESYPGDADLASHEQFPTRGLMQVIDVADLSHPRKVAQYDPVEFGVHNLYVDGGVMYIGAYNGGIRVLDVSGELLGDLKAQGRVIGNVYTGALDGYRPNMALTWSAIPHGGYIYASDINTGLWVARLVGRATP